MGYLYLFYDVEIAHVIMTMPPSGIFFIGRLGLATINLQTKFEVFNCTHYEDMRSGAKCTNWGSWGA